MVAGEFDLIDRFFDRGDAGSVCVDLGIGDDAAIIRPPPDRRIVTAVDTLVAGVHFPTGLEARYIGHRALAVNLSDLAAMGATPFAAMLALTVPEARDAWLEAFADGFFDLAVRYDVSLIGGDTTRGPLTVSVQVFGLLPMDAALTRSGAVPGDGVWVTGHPGDAAAGVESLAKNDAPAGEVCRRFLLPEPRVDIGCALLPVASAAIDISDGLLIDLNRIAVASGVNVRLDLDALPLSETLRHHVGDQRARELALYGGDDCELVFTAPGAVDAVASTTDVPVTKIGDVEKGEGLVCISGGKPVDVPVRGYDHFAGGSVDD